MSLNLFKRRSITGEDLDLMIRMTTVVNKMTTIVNELQELRDENESLKKELSEYKDKYYKLVERIIEGRD